MDASDREHPKKISTLKGHTSWIGNVVFSSDGNTLASTEYGKIILWDIKDPEKPKQISTIPTGYPNLYSVAFGKDDKILASGNSADGTISLWDISDPKKPNEIASPLSLPGGGSGDGYTPVNLAFDPSRNILIASDGSSITFWNVGDPTQPGETSDPLTHYAGTDLRNLYTMALSRDGKKLAVFPEGAEIDLHIEPCNEACESCRAICPVKKNG